jgi:hypothetical protein
MESEGSLPHTRQPTTCFCPEPDQLSSHLPQGLPIVLFPSVFPNKTIYVHFISKTAICPSHIIFPNLTIPAVFCQDLKSNIKMFRSPRCNCYDRVQPTFVRVPLVLATLKFAVWAWSRTIQFFIFHCLFWHVYVLDGVYFVWPWAPYRTIRDVTPGPLSATDTYIVYKRYPS